MKYVYGNGNKERHWPFRVAVSLLVALVGAFVVGGAYLVIDLKKETLENQTLTNTSSIAGVTTNTFETPFFRFQADSGWNLSGKDSGPTKFVFHHRNKTQLLDQELTIHVGTAPEKPRITRVLPISIIEGKRLAQDDIANPCKNYVQNRFNKNVQFVEHDSLSYWCTPDDDQLHLALVQKNGTIQLPFIHQGKTLNYTILYKDLRFDVDMRDITQLLTSFESL